MFRQTRLILQRRKLDERKCRAACHFRPALEALEPRSMLAVASITATDPAATELGQRKAKRDILLFQ